MPTRTSTPRLSWPASLLALALVATPAAARDRWTPEQAAAWQAKTPWLVGANYSPASAINQLEMWQADTFDPAAIDRELGWAESLGFTCVRVFLHDIPWRDDRDGFLKRIDQYLAIADKHHVGTMFVLFDSCWHPYPKAGKQPDPRPHLHNSGWVQCPGADELARWDEPQTKAHLEGYVKGIVARFKDDPRVRVWDVYNEPDNMNRPAYEKWEPKDKIDRTLGLLKQTFAWAREADPSQPLTSGVWQGTWADDAKLSPTEAVQLHESDVISFHDYSPLEKLRERVGNLRRYNRPMICTEYMARPAGSKFDPSLGYLKEQKVGAINWGFVSGKTQTIYPWDSWTRKYDAEPPTWFHDIFRTDGQPYDQAEVAYIRRQTGAANPKK